MIVIGAYDAVGRMTAANDNGSTTLATYDYANLGRPAGKQYAGSGDKVSCTWSPESDLLSQTHAMGF